MTLLISSVFTYDEDAGNYIQAVEAADTQALEPATRKAINNFVLGCKADNIWSAIKASCILAGARTLAGALVPLVGAAPTNFNFVSGDYNRKTGLVGNGSTKYLNSNRGNAADSQNNQHISVYLTTPPSIGLSLAGAGTGGTGSTNVLIGATRSRSATAATFTNATSGIVAASRNNASTYSQRVNNQSNTITVTSESPAAFNVLIYARSDPGASGAPTAFANPRLAFYSIGESLDLALLDARVTDLINAFAVTIP